MKIKDLIPKSVYCTIGYCDENHLLTLEQYINHNKFVLDLFDQIIVGYTNNGNNELQDKVNLIWYNSFKKVDITVSKENKGHTYGTMDLDNKVINIAACHNKEYIFKSTNDIIFFEQFLEKDIEKADFYYTNGIGYAGMENYKFDRDRIMTDDFFPQSNFYIIKSNIDYLNSENEINEVYELQKLSPDKKPWELKQGFESETLLKRCVERNKLTKYHLVGNEYYRRLLHVVQYFKIVDSSHKNILMDDPGLCHLHWPQNEVWEL